MGRERRGRGWGGTESKRENSTIVKETMVGILKACGRGLEEHDVLEQPSPGLALDSSPNCLCDLGQMI